MSATTTPAAADHSTVTYGDNTFTIADLPPASVAALLRKGIAHFLGNEMASKVTAWKATDEGKGATDDAIAAKRAEFVAVGLAAIKDGTLGVRATGGPRVTRNPLDTIMRRIAVAQLTAVLAKVNMTVPKGEKTITLDAADGTSSTFTRDQLIDRRLAHATHGPAIRKLAERELRDTAKVADGATGAGVDLLDA